MTGGAETEAEPRPRPPGPPPIPPADGVRGAGGLRPLNRGLAWLDGGLARWLPAEHNPLAQAGAAANVALLVAVASGILMLLWYSPSVQFAYPSLAAVPGRTPGGIMRSLHRYSSDLTMLFLLVHAARVFAAGKFAEARWLPWVSGVAMLALIWFIGWTGFWLVWDQPAQQVAVASMRLLDALPFFGEPLGRLYVADRTVPSLLFFVIFFLHMLLPLAIAVGLAVHLARLSRARLLPRRGLAWALVAAMILAAVAVPAPLDARAEMAVKAPAFTVDAWYLWPLALSLRLQSAGLWVALAGAAALGALVPWLLGRRRPPPAYQAIVTPERCHACTQCSQDCPFDAIRMVARTDGRRFPTQAWVDPARCVGCGVCSGSCDSAGIGLTWFDTRAEEIRIGRAVEAAGRSENAPAVALVAEDLAGHLPVLDGFQVHRVPTASWVRPVLVERLFGLGVPAVLVVRDASAEAWARDGGAWVEARLARRRKPELRAAGANAGRWAVVDFDPARPAMLQAAARELRRGGPFPAGGRRVVALGLAAGVLALVLGAATVAPSHLRVGNPEPAGPELVISFKAFGGWVQAAAIDAAAEAAKPVHMRGRATEKPRRAPVVVRLTIDGVTEERVFAAKGVSHDGPAIGEWRRTWAIGNHDVTVEIDPAGNEPPVRWQGTVQAAARRRQVLTFEPATGFLVE